MSIQARVARASDDAAMTSNTRGFPVRIAGTEDASLTKENEKRFGVLVVPDLFNTTLRAVEQCVQRLSGAEGRMTAGNGRMQDTNDSIVTESRAKTKVSTPIGQKFTSCSAAPSRASNVGVNYCMVVRNVHFPLKTRHLQRLVEHKQRGGKLESHADVPKGIRKQLRAEHDKCHSKKERGCSNVDQATGQVTLAYPRDSGEPAPAAGAARQVSHRKTCSMIWVLAHQDLDDGLCDYGTWQKSRSLKRHWQEACEKAEEVSRVNVLDLGQIGSRSAVWDG